MFSHRKSAPLRAAVLLSLLSTNLMAADMASTDVASATAAASRPKTGPTKTITNFSSALRCMDGLFQAFGKQGILITGGGIPDETGKVRTGTKDMMISAVSAMSRNSGAFEFVDLHAAGGDLGQLFALRGNAPRRVPNFYIRGSITQMDENVLSKTKAGGISLGSDTRGSDSSDILGLALGASTTEVADMMSMDISIGDVASRRILPLTTTSNTMVITKSSRSMEGGNTFGKVGLSFNMDRSQAQGQGATTRALLELSLIEALGKFTQVPYWRCLDTDITNPLIRQQASEGFAAMREPERILFVQRKLGGGMNRYRGPVDGVMNPELKQAIAEYQAAAGLVASGRIDFDLYASLIDDIQNPLAALSMNPGSNLR